MTTTSVAGWSTTAASNLELDGNDISEGCSPSGINDALRSLIAQAKTKFNSHDAAMAAITSSGIATVAKATKALLNADLAHADGTIALVYGDPTPSNNDIYAKTGASGSGSWSATGILAASSSAYASAAANSAAAAAASASAIVDMVSLGSYTNLLHGLSPTITNITDGTAVSATLTETADGLKIAAATANKDLLVSTNIKVGAPYTRLIATIKPAAVSGSLRVGLGFTSGANYASVTWMNNGWFIAVSNYGGGPTGVISQAFPTFASGATLTMQFDVTSDGGVYVTCSNGTGKRVAVGFTGIPISDVSLAYFDDTGTANASSKITEQAEGSLFRSASASATAATLSPSFRPGGVAAASFFAPYERLAPSGFVAPRLPSWFKVYKRPDSRFFFTTMDLQPILSEDDPTAFVQYVDVATGNDANAGTSTAPLKSINVALDNAASGSRAVIKVKGGVYPYDNCWKSSAPGAAVLQVVSWDGAQVVSSMHDSGLTWTLGTSSTYSATFTENVVNVFDAHVLTSDGDYSILTLAASLAACQATPGSYFITGTTIYVHAVDGRAPDANLRVYKRRADGFADYNGRWTKLNGQMYLENVAFEGGVWPFYTELSSSSYTQAVYGRSCTFKYGANSAPIVNGNVLCLWQSCIAAWNATDGFHYNPLFGSIPASGIEQDCIGRWNGLGGGSVNNNSSNHGGWTIRISTRTGVGDYHHAEHRGIHDITDTADSLTWNLGITSRDSRNSFANFTCGLGSGAPKMWNDTCTSSGAAIDQEAQAGATIYDSAFIGSAVNVGSGTITTYAP